MSASSGNSVFNSRLLLPSCDDGHRSALQEGRDQNSIDLQAAVVVDEALLLEPVHKFAYPCACGAHHFREGCLAHFQGMLRL